MKNVEEIRSALSEIRDARYEITTERPPLALYMPTLSFDRTERGRLEGFAPAVHQVLMRDYVTVKERAGLELRELVADP